MHIAPNAPVREIKILPRYFAEVRLRVATPHLCRVASKSPLPAGGGKGRYPELSLEGGPRLFRDERYFFFFLAETRYLPQFSQT